MARLFAGTSGFAYASWKPLFYPENLPANRFLQHYATRLNLVESNYTFRRTPSRKTLENWVSATPEHFMFAVKAHMRITHVLRLRDTAEATRFFFESLAPLSEAGRLGPVLFQLPPNLKREDRLLIEFLRLLPRDGRHAIEFRHPSWFEPAVFDLLKNENVALCRAESDKLSTPEVLTSQFAYFRLRKSEYPPDQRQEMARQARRMLAEGIDVFAVFKHEDDPAGVQYALELTEACAHP